MPALLVYGSGIPFGRHCGDRPAKTNPGQDTTVRKTNTVLLALQDSEYAWQAQRSGYSAVKIGLVLSCTCTRVYTYVTFVDKYIKERRGVALPHGNPKL